MFATATCMATNNPTPPLPSPPLHCLCVRTCDLYLQIPLPVTTGLFLYLGVSGLKGNEMWDRTKLLITDKTLRPKVKRFAKSWTCPLTGVCLCRLRAPYMPFMSEVVGEVECLKGGREWGVFHFRYKFWRGGVGGEAVFFFFCFSREGRISFSM